MFFHSDSIGIHTIAIVGSRFKPFQGCFSILTKMVRNRGAWPSIVSNPSRDVFPFWLSKIKKFGKRRIHFVSNPSRDVFPFWPWKFGLSGISAIRFKPFQGCFSILTMAGSSRHFSGNWFQTLPGMFFHSDEISISISRWLLNVSNPSRDVFPFWPPSYRILGTKIQEFQTLPGMFFHSDTREEGWTLWRVRYCFKPFQGCFSILTVPSFVDYYGGDGWFQTLPGMFFHSDDHHVVL